MIDVIEVKKELKCIHDMNAGDCFYRGGSCFMVTNGFIAGSQKSRQSRLCVNLSTGCVDFFNVWDDGIPVKARLVIGEE